MATNGTQVNGKISLDFSKFYNVINGELLTTSTTRHGINPSTLEANPEVPVSTPEDVNKAVEGARAAAESWAAVPLEERQQAVLKFAQALGSLVEDFGAMLTKEQGKPLEAAKGEIHGGVHWLTEQAKLPFPEDVVEETDQKRVVTRYTPLGVALGIVPWNFPVLLACGKIAPALISGNTFILKPSPFTPYCGMKLAELAQHFFPPGVFQALSGSDDLGPWLTAHPGIDKVSFTGSTATGKRVMESCSKTLKRVTLELGGNDPAIVCNDIDIKEAVPKIARTALGNSGQVCIAIKRLYVHSSIYPQFLAELVDHVKNLPVGDGFKENVFMGPIQNAMQYERVKGFLEDAEKQNHKMALKGGQLTSGHADKGYFFKPTIIDNPPDDSRIVAEEPFGPIFPILQWDNEDEVLRRANDTLMGLGASIWTKDADRADRMGRKLKAGNVWINTHSSLQPNATFGGHKQSGLGAEWGVQGLRSYCNPQTVYFMKG